MKSYIKEDMPELTALLRAGKRKDFRKRPANKRDMNAALWAAAAYAREGRTVYVYVGNYYGHAYYAVAFKRSDADCFVNNCAGRWLEIDTTLAVSLHEAHR